MSKRSYQFGVPLTLPSLEDAAPAQGLKRLRLDASTGPHGYSEAWLQRLVHRHPLMLPVQELEPGLGPLVPVALELPTPAGYLDNLFVTAEGNLVLVECKLWRNPEARRRVIAQIIDYAQSVAFWGYEQLDAAVRKCPDGGASGGLFERVSAAQAGELDEASFVDAVQRNLKLGRMLLLVLGDGIREDTESLADYLQQHAGFHFTLALVETAVFELGSGFLAQARVLARTLNIERAVVSLVDGRLMASPVASTAEPATARTLSEEAFFDQLKANDPQTATALTAFLDKARDVGVFLDLAGKTAILRWEAPSGRSFNLGGIGPDGLLKTYSVGAAPNTIGQVELAHDYLRKVGALSGTQVRQTPSADQWYLVSSGTTLPSAKVALLKADQWVEVIAEYQRALMQTQSEAA